jgi:hypothetical protein
VRITKGVSTRSLGNFIKTIHKLMAKVFGQEYPECLSGHA